MSQLQPMPEFLRFTAPDPEVHARSVAALREQLAQLQGNASVGRAVDETALLEVVADLAGLLITARQEGEALQLLQAHEALAEAASQASPVLHEALGWFWCAYATASQYLGQRSEAEPIFARTVALCEAGGWARLRAMVLQHWGRSLAEQGRFDEAESRFQQALALRVQLQDPRQATTREALALLAQLRDRD
ncbi:tetratricopeptide repeat protein [Paucibacter sp. DJ2R-2]|uniref:tetratricopeptide repeat protein n=1 Tax=Paucibacter sp. DJ2R-2 TaxID=2893558 RepID=UPI0021E516F7|nr:tetratricopeptide repeat protein [Paucibacter sp. DJ2R-2]MCV2421373.1 tetratricopeptide repeat protein [Paucibacter sp. DJ4R-1]MCV2441172.1 tetratricopeptide repeat protein [Paucibacter sp. DJ2R-2]